MAMKGEGGTQGKVSIVIPCYNKESYVGAMLDSVLAQRWDNVEVVIVNDGSTDGTLGVIEAYLPKFRARGFEVRLVDQANGGACDAVYNGLRQITGDYLALIDADDELDAAYVSTMAGWLEGHPDCEYCCCDFLVRQANGIDPFSAHPMYMDGQYSLELFLARNVNKAAWAFLVRASYFRHCGILDNLAGLGHCSYEPGICIPLAAHGGKMKAFSAPLYIYNVSTDGMSRATDAQRYRNYCDEYHGLTLKELAALPPGVMDKFQFSYCASVAHFYKLRCLWDVARVMGDGGNERRRVFHEFTSFLGRWTGIEVECNAAAGADAKECQLFCAVESRIVGMARPFEGEARRVVGYGALGKRAAGILPRLEGSKFYPTELWDAAADGARDGAQGATRGGAQGVARNGATGCSRVKKPDFGSLTENDVVLVFPTDQDVVSEIQGLLRGCRAKAYYRHEIDYMLAEIAFPQVANFKLI
jgi:glycosyltransferase involved in cell wall biosynthesis